MALEMMKLQDVFSLKQVVDNQFAIKLFKAIQANAYKAARHDALTEAIKTAQKYTNYGDSAAMLIFKELVSLRDQQPQTKGE